MQVHRPTHRGEAMNQNSPLQNTAVKHTGENSE